MSDPAAFASRDLEMTEPTEDAAEERPTFGQILRELRVHRLLQPGEVAAHLGVTGGHIYRWETGIAIPPLGMILKIPEALNLSVPDREELFRTLIDPSLLDSLQPQNSTTTHGTEEYVASLITRFDFPEEVREACIQYLVYFTRFLKEAGIEATSEVLQKAGQTLFTVTPTDATVALSKIREALDIYLQIP
jgi:transcriptional regulator with XRE-family HTH domain